MMCRPETVARWIRRGRDTEQLRDVLRRLVHRVPKLEVARSLRVRRSHSGVTRIGDRHESSLGAEFILFARPRIERHATAGVVRLHLADRANRHDDVCVVRILVLVERVDVRNLLEQLGFRVAANRTKPGGGDLQVECRVVIRAGELVTAFDEECRRLQRLHRSRKRRQGRPRESNVQVRTQVRHEVGADASVRRGGNVAE